MIDSTDAALWLLGAVAVFFGWRVFATQSMVRSAFLLLLSFIATAAMLLLLAAPYIAVATIFMMAVEMMVMALFMVMFMMNPAGLNPMMMVHQQRFAIAAGAAAFMALAAATLTTDFPTGLLPAGISLTVDLGHEILGGSMLIFETVGVTLLATMVGSVILSSRAGRFGAADTASTPPGLELDGMPAGRVPDAETDAHSHHSMGSGDGHGGHAG